MKRQPPVLLFWEQDQPITRMEAASMIYKALAYLGKLPPLD